MYGGIPKASTWLFDAAVGRSARRRGYGDLLPFQGQGGIAGCRHGPSPLRECTASSRRLGPSSIPLQWPLSNNAADPRLSIPIATRHSDRIGPLRGFLPRGLFDACPQESLHAHSHVNEGRHPITLNGIGRPHRAGVGQFQSLTEACSRTLERPQYVGSGLSTADVGRLEIGLSRRSIHHRAFSVANYG
jgi:hypothetical protein